MKKMSYRIGVILGASCFSFPSVKIASAKPQARRKAAPRKLQPRRFYMQEVPLLPQEIERLNKKLADLLTCRTTALREYTPTSSKIQALNREIAAVRRQLRGQRDAKARILPPANKPQIQLLGFQNYQRKKSKVGNDCWQKP